MIYNKYLLAFTAADLKFTETISLVGLFKKTNDWNITKKQALDNNLLQTRTQSTSIRLIREIIARLKLLTEDELSLLLEGNRSEQNILLWLGICKRYQYIRDFAVEILHEKFLRMDLELSKSEYDQFFNAKAEWHEELDRLTDSTKIKVKQILFRIMKDAEILTTYDTINPALFTTKLASVLVNDPSFEHMIYPVNLNTIKELTQ